MFQLWDGLANHKILRLHQVRYDVELLPYDIAWNVAGGVLLAVGTVLTVSAVGGERRSGDDAPAR